MTKQELIVIVTALGSALDEIGEDVNQIISVEQSKQLEDIALSEIQTVEKVIELYKELFKKYVSMCLEDSQ